MCSLILRLYFLMCSSCRPRSDNQLLPRNVTSKYRPIPLPHKHMSHDGTEVTVIYRLYLPPRRKWIVWYQLKICMLPLVKPYGFRVIKITSIIRTSLSSIISREVFSKPIMFIRTWLGASFTIFHLEGEGKNIII